MLEALIFKTFFSKSNEFSMRLCGLALYSDLSIKLGNTKYSERLRELVEHEMSEASIVNKKECEQRLGALVGLIRKFILRDEVGHTTQKFVELIQSVMERVSKTAV